MSDAVALVTGGSRGIGRAICIALARGGGRVAINYRSGADEAKETLRLVESAGGEGIALQADVRVAGEVDSMFHLVEEAIGPVSVLVNNAGIRRDALAVRMSEVDWREVIATSLDGAFLCSKRALRPMIRNGFGRIVNVASVAGLRGNPGQANYCAAKAGVIGLTKSLARELASKCITVNAVAPGLIETQLTTSLSEERYADLVGEIPAARAGTSEEVAEVVAFLCSNEASYVTGAVWTTDGGLTA